MAGVHVSTSAVAGALLARLRDERTGVRGFRSAAHELGSQLAREAADLLPHVETEVTSPLGTAPAVGLPKAVVVPVLRAGLGLLPGVLDVFGEATVGMVGLARDEQTLVAEQYYNNVPPLEGRHLLVLEPMLATGGSAADALALLHGAASRTVLSVVATRQAVDRILADHADVTIITAGIDPELNDQGWIVPGLGDFGDRLWGT